MLAANHSVKFTTMSREGAKAAKKGQTDAKGLAPSLLAIKLRCFQQRRIAHAEK